MKNLDLSRNVQAPHSSPNRRQSIKKKEMKKQKCYKKKRNVTEKVDVQQRYQDIRTLEKQLQNYADENLEIQEKGYYTCPKCGNATLFCNSDIQWKCTNCQRGGNIVDLASKVEGINISESLAFLSNKYGYLIEKSVTLLEYRLCFFRITSGEQDSKPITQSEAISYLASSCGASDFELRCLTELWKNTDREALAGLEIAYLVSYYDISYKNFTDITLKNYQDCIMICQYIHQEAISLCEKLVCDKTVSVKDSEVYNLDYLLKDGFLGRFLKEAKSKATLGIPLSIQE